MKKNVLLQIRIDTGLLDKLRDQSKDSGITMSDLCRQIITSPPQLKRIENQLERIEKAISMIENKLSVTH